MGELRVDVLKVKTEFNIAKNKFEKYRVILNWSFYSGGAFLLLVLSIILFPPEQPWWRFVSNICFTVLLLNLWVSYWLICSIKSIQRNIGELRVKLIQLAWEKICDCKQPCDCVSKMEKEIMAEDKLWNDGILAEVEHGDELS